MQSSELHPPPSDPFALERLYQQTLLLASASRESLLKLFYWTTFLELSLASPIRDASYREDACREISDALGKPELRLFDPPFTSRLRETLRGVAEAPFAGTALERLDGLSHKIHPAEPQGEGSHAPKGLSANVLLILRGRPLWGRSPIFGVPCAVVVEAFESRRARGEITWQSALLPDDSVKQSAIDALRAALACIGATQALHSYRIEIPGRRGELHGNSLGLALGVVFAAFEAAAQGRPHHLPGPGDAYIGGLDAAGRVLAASPASLAHKVRAAQSSGIRRIFLPAESAAKLDEELAGSTRAESQPELVTAGSLQEVFSNVQLVPGTRSGARRLIHRRPRYALIASLVALAVLAPTLWVLGELRRPWGLEQTSISMDVGSLPDTTEARTARAITGGGKNVIVAADTRTTRVIAKLSGFPPLQRSWDFGSPVRWAQAVSWKPGAPLTLVAATFPSGSSPAHVFCIDIQHGDTLWSRDFSRRLPMPEGFYATASILITDLLVTDLDGDGRQDLIVVADAVPNSPCFVAWLDMEGREHGFYAHRGYLVYPRVVDLEGDGHPEILLSGTSNSSDSLPWRGTIVALDARHFAGWPREWPLPPGMRTGYDSSYATLIFPPIPEHCRMTDASGYTASAVDASGRTAPGNLMVHLFTQAPPGLIVTLDSRLRPVAVEADDALIPKIRRALEEGKIRTDFTAHGGLEAYMRRIVRWGPGAR